MFPLAGRLPIGQAKFLHRLRGLGHRDRPEAKEGRAPRADFNYFIVNFFPLPCVPAPA